MKRILVAATAAFLALTGASAAATLDFVAEAAGNERGIVSGSVINNFQGTGIDVKISSGSGSPYFDDLSGGRAGGLGACSTLTLTNQCSPSSDDNLDSGESPLTLAFKLTGTDTYLGGIVDSLFFRNADHYLFNGNVGVNGTIYAVINGALNFAGGLEFDANGLTIAWAGKDLYLSRAGGTSGVGITVNPVPLPAGMVLLITALGGIAAVGRFNKQRTA